MTILINIVKFICVTLVTYFMCEIITDKKRWFSILGTLLICFSTAIIEYINEGLVEALVFGELVIIFLNMFLSKENKFKILKLLGMSISLVLFLLLTNLSWQISIGTVFFALSIWIFIKNKSSFNKKNILYLLVATIISVIVSVLFYNYKVITPKENENIILYLTSYFYYYILPFNESVKYETVGALTTMISVFPLPFILSLIYINKFEKHMEFIIPVAGIRNSSNIINIYWNK